jgi:glycosyltransferase involved in cell wall biosynthesis
MGSAIDEAPGDKLISIVVPVLDEVESLPQLAREIMAVSDSARLEVELLFVDDGSRDGSWEAIVALSRSDARIRGIRLRRNFGKATALAAGFEAANGRTVMQMDADLQDDPAEIPRFLQTLDSGFDLVNGWKQQRQDPWHKVWPSAVFNRMVSTVSGLRLHDHNCGFKCFRSPVVKQMRLYGELHRFITVMAHAEGYRVAELAVQHRPRRHGRSKYGIPRIFKGFLDLMTVTFLTGFAQRPLHLLGGIGLVAFVLGFAGLSYLTVLWLLTHFEVRDYGPIGQRPLLTYSVAGLLLGFQMLAIGFLAELIISMNMRNQPNQHVAECTPICTPGGPA